MILKLHVPMRELYFEVRPCNMISKRLNTHPSTKIHLPELDEMIHRWIPRTQLCYIGIWRVGMGAIERKSINIDESIDFHKCLRQHTGIDMDCLTSSLKDPIGTIGGDIDQLG